MDEKMPAAGLTRYAHTYAPHSLMPERLAIAIRREIDWIVREARLAGDGREAEKRRASSRARHRCGCSRGERAAKEAELDYRLCV